MGYEQILYEVEEGIATVTLNRPEKLNAFTGTMGEEIYDAFGRATDDPEVRSIVLTGAGSGFCAGVDLTRISDPGESEKIRAGNFIRKFADENYHRPKPTICAINGAAVGVGVTMVLSFDLRVAALDAKLRVPFVKLGMLPGFGTTRLLPQLVGRGRALDLLLSARPILGEEALEIGLVERAVPAEQVLPTALELARALAGMDPLVLEYCKRSVAAGMAAGSLAEAVESEQRHNTALRDARTAAGR
ncbi:MAG: enoyl-CoA hydratase/isomerase family protein [Proteobacteria bacterium]|nr:enoyl-CoA hydratase/isomerase family protein [Pseudomonadota bacterium]